MLEIGVEPRQRRAELLGDHEPLGLSAGEGRDGVVERAERLRVLERHVVRPQGEHLTRLDERRSEPLEHLADSVGQRERHVDVVWALCLRAKRADESAAR